MRVLTTYRNPDGGYEVELETTQFPHNLQTVRRDSDGVTWIANALVRDGTRESIHLLLTRPSRRLRHPIVGEELVLVPVEPVFSLSVRAMTAPEALAPLGDLIIESGWRHPFAPPELVRRFNVRTKTSGPTRPTKEWARTVVAALICCEWGRDVWPSVVRRMLNDIDARPGEPYAKLLGWYELIDARKLEPRAELIAAGRERWATFGVDEDFPEL